MLACCAFGRRALCPVVCNSEAGLKQVLGAIANIAFDVEDKNAATILLAVSATPMSVLNLFFFAII